MKWLTIRKQIVKRGPKSTGINFYKDEVPFEKVGEWIEIKVPNNFGTFKSTDNEGVKNEVSKDNGAYLKARRQIYQNVFYYIVGNQKRRPDLITTENVIAFIKIRDTIEQYFTEIIEEIKTKKIEIEDKINSFDIIRDKKDGYKQVFVYVETYKTTMYINKSDYNDYKNEYTKLTKYNDMLRNIDEIVIDKIRHTFSNVDPVIIDAAMSDYYSKKDYSTKKLLEGHSRMIMNSITRK